MCLIVVKPVGVDIPDFVIESAAEYNADGFGIMYEGTAKRWKHRTVPQIKKLLKPLTDKNVAVHFRMATDGRISAKNAHPFKLSNQAYLMHNGILTKYRTDKSAADSDTARFVKTFCNPLIAKHGSIPRKQLEHEITGNAIAIMQKDGVIKTYGHSWVNRYSCDFSNTYAWDSAESVAAYKSYNTHAAAQNFVSDTYCGSVVTEIYLRLAPVVDLLPLTDCSYVSYADLQLCDDIANGYIEPRDFLESCSEETLLELYTYAVGYNII